VEVIRAAAAALGATGLRAWRVELGHAGLAGALLREVPAHLHDLAAELAMSQCLPKKPLGARWLVA
jgi:ATP phosphoribosyltransferase regulatory subunit HisZ